MLSGSQIRNINDVAAYRAAEEGRYPLYVMKAQDARYIPFLGDYVPSGFRRLDDTAVLVDATGFDHGGPAMESDAFAESAIGSYWAIIEQGEFQIVAAEYVVDDTSTGSPAPDRESVVCSECDEVHSDLEECFIGYEYDEEYE